MDSRESVTMRCFTLLIGAIAGLLAPLTFGGATAHGEAFKPWITTADIHLRKAPGTDGEILAVIPKGTAVGVDNCRGGWCEVSWNGQAGYARDHNLGLAAPPQWLNGPVVAWPSNHGSSQKTGKTARGREKGEGREQNEHEEEGPEHSFILEIGTVGEWPLNGERPNFGGTIAGEIEPIENWLELELGLSTLATAGHTELSGDLLFKKPFRLSPTVEFMIGGGPSYSHTLNGPDRGGAWSAEFALEWMFWPTRNLGWFIEPTWSVNPRNGQQSAAVSVGLLIGFPK
jgi:hypothetical protein